MGKCDSIILERCCKCGGWIGTEAVLKLSGSNPVALIEKCWIGTEAVLKFDCPCKILLDMGWIGTEAVLKLLKDIVHENRPEGWIGTEAVLKFVLPPYYPYPQYVE